MSDETPQDKASTADWQARRAALDARLRDTQERRQVAETAANRSGGSLRGMAQGLKIASEFVAGVAVGAFIGFGIDYFAGTSPFGLVIFLLFGFAAGVMNVVRGSASTTAEMARQKEETKQD